MSREVGAGSPLSSHLLSLPNSQHRETEPAAKELKTTCRRWVQSAHTKPRLGRRERGAGLAGTPSCARLLCSCWPRRLIPPPQLHLQPSPRTTHKRGKNSAGLSNEIIPTSPVHAQRFLAQPAASPASPFAAGCESERQHARCTPTEETFMPAQTGVSLSPLHVPTPNRSTAQSTFILAQGDRAA